MFLKDVRSIENIQRRDTKYILNDYSSCYRSKLKELHILPLMMQFEINDILFFVTCLKNPTESFNILKYVKKGHLPSSNLSIIVQEQITSAISTSIACLVSGTLFPLFNWISPPIQQANKVLLEPFHQIL